MVDFKFISWELVFLGLLEYLVRDIASVSVLWKAERVIQVGLLHSKVG